MIRVAFVTGGSRGIGEGIARRLARDGFRVAIGYRSVEKHARRTLAAIRECSPESIVVRADVTVEREAERALEQVLDTFGRIDVLVNNVGDFYETPVAALDGSKRRDLFASNVESALHCAKAALPSMRRRKSGVIINLGGTVSQTLRGNPRYYAYSMAKTALVVFTKSLAQAEAGNGIRVNIVNPGYIRTYAYTGAEIRDLAPKVPMKRLGEPAEVAAAVSFLASADASYITGAVLDVCGGLWV